MSIKLFLQEIVREFIAEGGNDINVKELRDDADNLLELRDTDNNVITNVTADGHIGSNVLMPKGMDSTARDALTAVAGMIIFNTTASKHQGYDGTTWNDLY